MIKAVQGDAEVKSPSPADVPGSRYPSLKVGWYSVAILSCAAILSYTDRYILNLLVDSIRHGLAITDAQISYLQGAAFAVIYAVLVLPIGRYADRHNRRNLIVAGVVLWSVATAACGFAANFRELLIARVFVGLGEAALAPAAMSLIADFFPPARRGAPIGVFLAAVMSGGALAEIIGGALIGDVASGRLSAFPWVGHLVAWRAVLIFLALPGTIMAAVLATIREPVRRESMVTAAQGREPQQFHTLIEHFRRNRWTFLTLFGAFTIDAIRGTGTDSWMPMVFIREFHFSAAHTGTIVGSTLLVFTTAGALAGGVLSDWAQGRGRNDGGLRLALWATCAELLVVVFPIVASPIAMLLGYGIFCLFANFAWTAAQAAILNAVPTEMRGFTTGLQASMYTLIGMGVGPTIVALTTEFVYRRSDLVGVSIFTVLLPCSILVAVLLARSLAHYHLTRADVVAGSSAAGREARSSAFEDEIERSA